MNAREGLSFFLRLFAKFSWGVRYYALQQSAVRGNRWGGIARRCINSFFWVPREEPNIRYWYFSIDKFYNLNGLTERWFLWLQQLFRVKTLVQLFRPRTNLEIRKPLRLGTLGRSFFQIRNSFFGKNDRKSVKNRSTCLIMRTTLVIRSNQLSA